MDINLLNTNDNANVINKKTQLIKTIQVVLRQAVDEQSPVLILHANNLVGVNYIQIPKFKRYYFIDQAYQYNNKLTRIQLKTDLLMTYQNEIMNKELLVTATEKPSYLSTQLPTSHKLISDTYKSDTTLPAGTTKVLTTIGG